MLTWYDHFAYDRTDEVVFLTKIIGPTAVIERMLTKIWTVK